MTNYFALISILFVLVNGADDEVMIPIGSEYALCVVGEDSSLHEPGNQRLYKIPVKGKKRLVWSYISGDQQAVFDDFVVFNGGLTDARTWKTYPALFAFSGTGVVVEISAVAAAHLKNSTNYSFEVRAKTNDVMTIYAIQRPPADRSIPISTLLTLEKSEIIRAVIEAQTNHTLRFFGETGYAVAH